MKSHFPRSNRGNEAQIGFLDIFRVSRNGQPQVQTRSKPRRGGLFIAIAGGTYPPNFLFVFRRRDPRIDLAIGMKATLELRRLNEPLSRRRKTKRRIGGSAAPYKQAAPTGFHKRPTEIVDEAFLCIDQSLVTSAATSRI